jgi:hypothetical protein
VHVEFTIPNDHGHPESYSRPYSLHVHVIEADVMAAASALATDTRSTVSTVMLSAFYVLAHQITGTTDLTIRAFTAGWAADLLRILTSAVSEADRDWKLL